MDKELSRLRTSKLFYHKKGPSKPPLYAKVYLKPRTKKQKSTTKRGAYMKLETKQPLLCSVALSKSRKTTQKNFLESINLEKVLREAYRIPQPSFSFFEKLRINSPALIRSNSVSNTNKQHRIASKRSKKNENQELRSVNSTSDTKSSKSSLKNIRLKQRCKISNIN